MRKINYSQAFPNKMKYILMLVIAIFCLNVTVAQEADNTQETEKAKWNYLAEIYMMFPSMNGDLGIAELPLVEVDADAGDILGHLKMGAMLYFEANNGNWAISSDLLYMKLGQDLSASQEVAPGELLTSGKVIMKQTAWEVAGLKKVTNWLDAGVGGKLISLYTELDFQTTLNDGTINSNYGDATKTWYDPIIIVRSQGVVKENWLLQFRGDIGGFGIGSDLSWQLQGNVGYKFSELFQTSIGYRYISIDYDKGEGLERFRYDVDTYGFVLRLGFNF